VPKNAVGGSPDARTSPRRLRVCHVAYTFYESDNRVLRYAETLVALGAEVDVIALRRRGEPQRGQSRGVRIFRIQRRAITERSASTYLLKTLLFVLRSSFRLCILQVLRPYDVVHVHNVPDFLVFAALLPKLMGAKVILDIHDILPELYAGKFGGAQRSTVFRSLLFVERMSCLFAHHVIVANHLWHEKLIERTVEDEKCTTIMNYPDLRLFRPPPEANKRTDNRFIMLYPGTLNRHQGVDIAIRAFGRVAESMPSAELRIYGEGPTRDELFRLIHELQLTHRVSLLPRVSLEEISHIMAVADVGIIPKRADGFGNEAFSTKTLEFMACGVPIILSRTCIDERYFTDALVRFVEPGNEHDLADAMREVYAGRMHNAEWIRAARKFAVENSWQERGVIYSKLIEALTQESMRQNAVAS
jgi:glycosyltransferase involved in cell wall biosynthesis